MRKHRLYMATLAFAVAAAFAPGGFAGTNEPKQWIEKEFQPSTLSKAQQLKEMEWFINAAKPFKGLEINVLSETIPTHEYESKTLTRHREALRTAVDSLEKATELISHGGALLDQAVTELYRAAAALGEITGETAGEAILERVFSRHCIGK